MDRQSDKITALYCRTAGPHGDMDALIRRNQMKQLAAYAAEHGLRNPEFFCDWGFWGTAPDRPQYQRMLRKVETGGVSDLVVWNVSRLWRSLMAGYELIYVTLPRCGVTLHVLQGNIICPPQDMREAAAWYEGLPLQNGGRR